MVRPTGRLVRHRSGLNRSSLLAEDFVDTDVEEAPPLTWEEKMQLLQHCQKYSTHFNGWDTADLAILADEMILEEIPVGRIIIRMNEEATDVLLMVRGRAEVRNPRYHRGIAILQIGDLVGELSAFQGGARSASVVSVSDDTVVTRFSLSLRGLGFQRRHPQLWLGLLRMFARAGIAHLRLAYNVTPQSSFDERPLKKEDFVHILNNSGEVRESFGWQWSPSELEVLGTCMYFMSVPRGHQLFKKGYWYEHMLIVLQGSLEAFVDGPNSASLGRKGYGEWLGGATFALGLMNPTLALHPCDVYAAEYTEILHINRRAMEQLYSTQPQIAMKLYFMIMGVVLAQFVEDSKEPSRQSVNSEHDAVTNDESEPDHKDAAQAYLEHDSKPPPSVPSDNTSLLPDHSDSSVHSLHSETSSLRAVSRVIVQGVRMEMEEHVAVDEQRPRRVEGEETFGRMNPTTLPKLSRLHESKAAARRPHARAVVLGGCKWSAHCYPRHSEPLPEPSQFPVNLLIKDSDATWSLYSVEQLVTMLDNFQSFSAIFRGFSPSEIGRIARMVKVFTVSEGGMVVREGRTVPYVGMMLSGKADVSMSGSRSVYSLQTGDLLGASSVFHTGAWVASAKCVSHTCQVAVLEVYMVVELCRKDPRLGQRMMRVLAYAAVRAQREVVMAKGRRSSAAAFQMNKGMEHLPRLFDDDAFLAQAGMGGNNHVRMLSQHVRVAQVKCGALILPSGPRSSLRGISVADDELTGPFLIFVLDGCLSTMRQGEEISTWGPGECVGGEGFLLESPMDAGSPCVYPEEIVATGRPVTTVAFFTYQQLEHMNLDYPKFAQSFFCNVVRHYLHKLAQRQVQRRAIDDPSPAVPKKLPSGVPRWQAELSGLQFGASVNPLEGTQFVHKEKVEEEEEFLGAPLCNMMRMKGRGASLVAAEEIAKLLGGVVSARPKSHLLDLLRGCRRTSNLWNEISPSEINVLPDVLSLVEVNQEADDADANSGGRWRTLIAHSQSVPFWLFLLCGKVRWRLPREQAADEGEQGAHKHFTLQAGEALGDVSLLCGVPHIGVLECCGPVLLATLGSDAFIKMGALHHSSTHRLAVKLVAMIINTAIDKMVVSLPSTLGSSSFVYLAPSPDETRSEHLKLMYLQAVHKSHGCFGQMDLEDVPMLFLYMQCITLPAQSKIVVKNQVGTALYLVLDGVAEILEDYGAERRVGEYVGEDAFFQSTSGLRVYRKTVVAKSDMVLGILAFETLEAMMRVRPDLAVDIIMNVGRMMVQRSLDNCVLDIHDPSAGVLHKGPSGTPHQVVAPLSGSSDNGGVEHAHIADNREGWPRNGPAVRWMRSPAPLPPDQLTRLMDQTQACSRFWTGFDAHELEVLAQHVMILQIQKGETIVAAGGGSKFMGVIAKGAAEGRVNGQKFAALKQGDVVGEVGMFKNGFNFMDVTSTHPNTLLLTFQHGSLKHFFIKYPDLGLKMMRQFYTAAVTKLADMELNVLPLFDTHIKPFPSPLVAVTQLLYSAHHSTLIGNSFRYNSFGPAVPYGVLDKLACYLSITMVPAGRDIWHSERVGPAMMLMVLEGEVEVRASSKDSQLLSRNPKGTLVGTDVFLECQHVRKCVWRNSAFAGRSGAKLAIINHEVLAKMTERYPVDSARLYARLGEMVVAEKLEDMNTQMALRLVQAQEQAELQAIKIPDANTEAFQKYLQATRTKHALVCSSRVSSHASQVPTFVGAEAVHPRKCQETLRLLSAKEPGPSDSAEPIQPPHRVTYRRPASAFPERLQRPMIPAAPVMRSVSAAPVCTPLEGPSSTAVALEDAPTFEPLPEASCTSATSAASAFSMEHESAPQFQPQAERYNNLLERIIGVSEGSLSPPLCSTVQKASALSKTEAGVAARGSTGGDVRHGPADARPQSSSHHDDAADSVDLPLRIPLPKHGIASKAAPQPCIPKAAPSPASERRSVGLTSAQRSRRVQASDLRTRRGSDAKAATQSSSPQTIFPGGLQFNRVDPGSPPPQGWERMSERRHGYPALGQGRSRPASAMPCMRSREIETPSGCDVTRQSDFGSSKNLGARASGSHVTSGPARPSSTAMTAVTHAASSRVVARPGSATSSQPSGASRQFSANHTLDKALKGALQYRHRRARSARPERNVSHPFASVTWDDNPDPPIAQYAKENERRLARALDFDDDAMQEPLSAETISMSHMYGDALVPRSFRPIC